MLKSKTEGISNNAISWISSHFNIRMEKIETWITQTEETAFSDAGFIVGRTIMGLSSTAVVLTLLPVYLFMILYYKALLLEFIRRLFKHEDRNTVQEVLSRTKHIIQSYLVGLVIEALIMACLNTTALMVLGIDYAIVLGVTGALVNVIPFIGGGIAIILPMTVAFVTKDSLSYPVAVLGIYLVIQFIDNHYIIPRIVASKVKINALVSVVVVLIGGAIWGVPGMFLSIPMTAILKVIFDHIESMKPWGFLLGNIVPTSPKYAFRKPPKEPEINSNL